MITHGEFWGAGRAASRLFECFNQNNIQVKFLLVKKSGQSKRKITISITQKIFIIFISRIDKFICKLLEPNNFHWKTSAFLGVLSARAINKSNYDVINFHWIGHGLISLRQLSKITKPIIFTVNDEWLLNPISHYTNNLDTNTITNRTVRRILENRQRVKEFFLSKKNVIIVSVSEEIANKFRLKFPNKRKQIFVIPNPVDTKIFFPDTDPNPNFENHYLQKPYIFFAGGTKDKRKGWDLLEKSLKLCKEKFDVLAIGAINTIDTGAFSQIKIHGLSNISNLEILRNLYSNAKLTVVPSRIEALPQVATESLSCGTPVVGFKIGGLEDIISNSDFGILVSKFNVDHLATAIDEIVRSGDLISRQKCRSHSIKQFSFRSIASKYQEIFSYLDEIC